MKLLRGHSWISIVDSQVHDLAHTHSLVSFQLLLCQDPALMKRKSALVTIWHHIQPLRGITKCKVRRVRNGYTMEDTYSMSFCMLCRIPLPLSSKWRTVSTSVEANKEAVKSMLMFLAATLSDYDSNQFRTQYTCRPWFAKLERMEADTREASFFHQ